MGDGKKDMIVRGFWRKTLVFSKSRLEKLALPNLALGSESGSSARSGILQVSPQFILNQN